jgi:hypothetical protein
MAGREKQHPSQPVVFLIRLRPEPGVNAIQALRRLLKTALRREGLHCPSIEEAEVQSE